MKTVTIGIGNSDDKLTQREWSVFCQDVRQAVSYFAEETHFYGLASSDALWQNACWVIAIEEKQIPLLKSRISTLGRKYKQNSVAWVEGITEAI